MAEAPEQLFGDNPFEGLDLGDIDWEQTVEDAKTLLYRLTNPSSAVTLRDVWKALQDCDLPLSDWDMCTEPFKDKIRNRFAEIGVFE